MLIKSIIAGKARRETRDLIKWQLRRRPRERIKAAGLLVYYRNQKRKIAAEMQV